MDKVNNKMWLKKAQLMPEAPITPPLPMGAPTTPAPPFPPMDAVEPEETMSELKNPKKPLSNVSDIITDFDIDKYITDNPSEGIDDTTLAIWVAYGGNQTGFGAGKLGQRQESIEDMPEEEFQNEVENTETQKWLRLPMGKAIDDIIDLGDLKLAVTSSTSHYIEEAAKKTNAGGDTGGGGGGGLFG